MLQLLRAAIEGRTSAVVTGDSGSGKTCLIRALEEDLPQGRYRLHYTPDATVNRRDFYRQISVGMGLEPHSSFAALCPTVSRHIQELATQHKLRVILVLDEGHLLNIQVLEQLHILLNFERDSKPWLSIILVGLSDLRETLKRNLLASLAAHRLDTDLLMPVRSEKLIYIRFDRNDCSIPPDAAGHQLTLAASQILLSSIAGLADPRENTAIWSAAKSLTKNNFRRIAHARHEARLDNRQKSWQLLLDVGRCCLVRRHRPTPIAATIGALFPRLKTSD